MSTRQLKLIASIAASLLAVLAFGLFMFLRPLSVSVAQPETSVPVQVFGVGSVEARILSKVAFEVSGTVTKVNADHGDRVNQGALLAQLDRAEQEARVEKADANVQQAQAALQKAGANLERTRAVLEQRKQTNQRQQSLKTQGTVSAEEVEAAQLAVDVAAADVNVAQSEVEVARAALRDAQAQQRLERTLLAQYTLTAPFDAIIVARHKEPGSVLAPGEPVFTLVDSHSLWGLVHIDERSAGAVQDGQPAEVRLRSSAGQPIAARVVRVDIESDRVAEERRVYLKCNECPQQFHLGEQIEAMITTQTLERAVLVPDKAIEGYDGTRGTVWTVENGTLARREATFGVRTLDGRLQVTGGIADGAQIVTELQRGLRPGRAARVRPVDAP